MSETTYLSALEFDLAGQVGKVHAIACYDAVPWLATACGLPAQAYPCSGAEWVTVETAVRCSRCVDGLNTPAAHSQ